MILVTGSSGFIGQALIKSFGNEAIGLQRSRPIRQNDFECDLVNFENIENIVAKLKEHSFTHIIHTAAVTPWSKTPNYQLDIDMAESVLVLSKRLNIPNIVFVSGWNVYDATSQTPFNESTPVNPKDDYGISKRRVEEFLERSDVATITTLRTASVYGPGQTSIGLIPNIVTAALGTGVIKINTNNVKRDYLFIDDFVTAIKNLVNEKSNKGGYINLGSGKSISINEVAELIRLKIENTTKSIVQIKTEPATSTATVLDNQLDIHKARALGILNNITSFEHGVEAYVTWRINENIL